MGRRKNDGSQITEKKLRASSVIFDHFWTRFQDRRMRRVCIGAPRLLLEEDSLCSFLFAQFNPIIDSMRGLCACHKVPKVQALVCGESRRGGYPTLHSVDCLAATGEALRWHQAEVISDVELAQALGLASEQTRDHAKLGGQSRSRHPVGFSDRGPRQGGKLSPSGSYLLRPRNRSRGSFASNSSASRYPRIP